MVAILWGEMRVEENVQLRRLPKMNRRCADAKSDVIAACVELFAQRVRKTRGAFESIPAGT